MTNGRIGRGVVPRPCQLYPYLPALIIPHIDNGSNHRLIEKPTVTGGEYIFQPGAVQRTATEVDRSSHRTGDTHCTGAASNRVSFGRTAWERLAPPVISIAVQAGEVQIVGSKRCADERASA